MIWRVSNYAVKRDDELNSQHLEILDEDNNVVAEIRFLPQPKFHNDRIIAHHNARLIAAAPEMLDLLKKAYDWLKKCQEVVNRVEGK